MQPIMEFKDIDQARESLKEWKERLLLHAWTIKIVLCEPHEFIGDDCDGECEYTTVV